MDSNHFDSGCGEGTIDFLHDVDLKYDRYDSFTQADSCPSLDSSFLTIDTTQQLSFDYRHSSLESASPDDLTTSSGSMTSPITPAGGIPWGNVYNMETWSKAPAHHGWPSQEIDAETLWMPSEQSNMANCVMNTFSYQDSTNIQPGYFYPSRPTSTIDPPLSRAVFHNAVPGQTPMDAEDPSPWAVTGLDSQAQTVEPSATFQTMLSSSPLSKFEPITPAKLKYNSASLFSSPISTGRSMTLASTWETEEGRSSPLVKHEEYDERQFAPRLLPSTGGVPLKEYSPSPKKPCIGKTGYDCAAVIPQNQYPCKFPNCMDKDGRRKCFKRQEHRKRHETTVHSADSKFKCWVVTGNKPCGRGFSRQDNLKSHLHKTHGKKSPNQRNCYVATLDPKSQYHDKDWQGPLTAEGLPIGHPQWPNIH